MTNNVKNKSTAFEGKQKSLDPSVMIPSPQPAKPNQPNQVGDSQQPVTPKPSRDGKER
jgi:hypothetical protein